MAKKIGVKKIATTIPEDAFVSRIEGLVGKVKNVTLDGTFSNMMVYEVEDTMFVLVDFTDCSGKIPTLIVGARDDEFRSFVESIIMKHEYRISGSVSLVEDIGDNDLTFINALKGRQVFCTTAIQDLSAIKLFGVDISKLYNYDLTKAYEFVNTHTDYLRKYPLNSVKEIMFSVSKDIIILLQDGVVLVNGVKQLYNIKSLAFMSGISIFAISNNNVITPITGGYASINFINNNNYEYKKIIVTPLLLIGLTYDGVVKIFGTLTDEPIDYNRLVGIDDIGYVAEDDDLVVIKKDKVYSLLLQHDYSNEVPEVMVDGSIDDVTIINK